jgi:hypothetical protein
MDAGSADADAAPTNSPTVELRSGNFAPGSPMAKKLLRREKEMLASWPENNDIAATGWPSKTPSDIPPTEPRPTTLNFENAATSLRSAPQLSDQSSQEHAPANSSAPTELRKPQKNTDENSASKQASASATPSYLQTTTTGNSLSMDTIIETVLGQYQCPTTLLTTKVRSFFDLLTDYKKRYPESKLTVTQYSCSETKRNQFNSYFSEFKSRNQWLTEPATVALLEKMATISPASRLIVQKTWIKCIGLSQTELYATAQEIKLTGEMGDRIATQTDLLSINYDGLAAVTTEALCNDGSGSDAADRAIDKLSNLDLSEQLSLSELLATELKCWQTCLRELDETPLANYWRLQNLKNACTKDNYWCDLKTALDDITSRKKNLKISKIKSWNGIESLLSEAYDLARKQGKLQNRELVDSDSSIDKQSNSCNDSDGLSVNYTSKCEAGIHSEIEKELLQIQTQKLECRDCQKEFTDSVDDQEHRLRRGWHNNPTRCPACKEIYLAQLAKNPQPCKDFSKGDCAYGDKCRFSHASAGLTRSAPVDREKPTTHFGENASLSGSDSDSIDLDCY